MAEFVSLYLQLLDILTRSSLRFVYNMPSVFNVWITCWYLRLFNPFLPGYVSAENHSRRNWSLPPRHELGQQRQVTCGVVFEWS